MKNLILITALLLFSVSAFGEQIIINSDLTEAQIAAIKAQVATMESDALSAAEKAATAVIDNPETVKQWAEMSSAIAQGVGDTAKELGVAANEFLDSPAGLITVVLIAYHFLGTDFIGVIAMFLIFPTLLFVYFRVIRWIRIESVTYNDEKAHWYSPRGKTVNIKAFDSEQMVAFIVTNIVFFFISWMVVANCMPG